jgi:hypothetical protein
VKIVELKLGSLFTWPSENNETVYELVKCETDGKGNIVHFVGRSIVTFWAKGNIYFPEPNWHPTLEAEYRFTSDTEIRLVKIGVENV